MSRKYRQILLNRGDMTKWLIHFTRNSSHMCAREVLLKILIEGVLRPGFALRGSPGKHTIYGNSPAVCFTEQPLSAFLQYLYARDDETAMAGYGILVHKHDVYVAGGLPVIYGLKHTEELESDHPDYSKEHRLLNPEHLNYSQQYRYVAFAPNREPYPLDWTHEREWRWPQNAMPFIEDVFGLGAHWFGNGEYKARVRAFVRYDDDILWMQKSVSQALTDGDIGIYSDNEESDYQIRWNNAIKKVHLLSLETVENQLTNSNLSYVRVEDLPMDSMIPLINEG